jgi:ATP-binding cassette subfamily F protein uup
MLARALARPSNLLVLDEPTNDLDLETLDLLQETLHDYAGTVLLVSHDRDFIDRLVTSTLISDGDGVWTEYAGGYSDMVSQRGRGVAARGIEPATKPAATPSVPPAATQKPVGKRRMSFNDKHALETLPGKIEALQADAARINAILSQGDLYQRDPKLFAEASKRLATVTAAIAEAENRWMELEMLREELDA